MSYPVEAIVTKLLPILFRVEGDQQIMGAAKEAAENLMQLVDAGAFSLRSQPNAPEMLMRTISEDPKMNGADRVVVKVLLDAFDKKAGDACISHHEICEASRFSLSAVRTSLRKLTRDGGYFRVIRPTQHQIFEGKSQALRYEPQFEERLTFEAGSMDQAS